MPQDAPLNGSAQDAEPGSYQGQGADSGIPRPG